MKNLSYILICLLLVPALGFSQDTIKKKLSTPMRDKAVKLEQSLSKSDMKEAAKNYEALGKEFMQNGDDAKAESYFKSALDLYKKQKNKSKISSVNRLIAQVQENQNKLSEAIQSYESAGAEAVQVNSSKLNTNDANRVRNYGNAQKQIEILDSNIELLEDKGSTEEQVQSYQKRAISNLLLDQKEEALDDYSKAIEIAKDQPEEVIRLKTEVAKVYESDHNLGKAIEVSEEALKEAKKSNNISAEIAQKKQLASLLNKTEDDEKAIQLLEEALQTALENNKTLEAKETLLLLVDLYQERGENEKSLALYQRFFTDFDQLIMADSTLVHAQIFTSTEERIKQLEKQQVLKDQLLLKTNRLNYVLIGSVFLLTLLMGYIIKSFLEIKKSNKKIALQSLRREMNPHFIFNSLNSVNQFIAQNNELEANKYLSSYSNLMRNMMETSNKDFIPLSNEIEQIKKYLDLEHLRFSDKFDYKIHIDPSIDTEGVQIPNMLIQPNLENAIWHGLRYKEEKGILTIFITQENNRIKVTIEDNGIGIKKSQELKTKNQKIHDSRGLNNVKERIKLLNDLYKKNITFEINERENESGTTVILWV